MTRARVFSKGLGGGGGANANINLADVLPLLTTANVIEIFPNVYYSNARVFANINLASLDDLFDVGNTTGKVAGQGLVWNGNVWTFGNISANLSLFTTDDLPQGNTNFYFSNALARRAFTAGTPSIVIDWNLGTISANLEAVAASANTTDTLPEGAVNLYYRDSRAHANLKLARLSDLSDVYTKGDILPTGHPGAGTPLTQVNTGYTLVWHEESNSWIAGRVVSEESNVANSAIEANTVLSLGNLTTNDLAEGNVNFYFTNARVLANVERMSINVLADVNTSDSQEGYILTYIGSTWVARSLGNISNIDIVVSTNFANTAGLANVALIANTANLALVASVANLALNTQLANSATFAFTANVANLALVALTALTTNAATQVQNLNNFTTANLAEGVNLYYTNARVLSNVEQMSINVLADVNTTNVSVGTGIGYVLTWTGSEWAPNALPGASDTSGFAERSNVANVALSAVSTERANVANTVLTLSNFTTADLRESFSNLYYTSQRVRDDIQNAILNKDIEIGDAIVNGNLNVRGNLTLLNSDNVLVKARRITLASQASGVSQAEGAGIYIEGANVAFAYSQTNDGWGLDKNLTINGNLLPAVNGQYNLGQPGKLWRGVYIGAQTIFLGNTSIGENPTGGLIVQDQFGNPAGIDLSNIVGTEYVSINRLIGNTNPEIENQAYIGGNVKQFTSGKTGNIYFGILKDGTVNEFAGMRVIEANIDGNVRSDVLFYNDYENRNNSTIRLGLYGDGNIGLTSNLVIFNNINLIDRFGNFVGNAFLGTTDVAIEKGGTGANTRPNARRNLFSDFSGGLVAKIGGATNTLVATSIVAGTGVYVTDGDAQNGSPTIAIGQNVHPTASVIFSNVTVNGQLNSDDITAAVITARTDLIVQGNLTIRGNITTINSTTVVIDDKNLVLANNAIDASQADGAGITINGANATINYASGGDKFVVNKALEVQGNLTLGSYSVTAEQVNVTGDKVILLSSVAGSPTSNASLVVNRGSSPDVDLKWNESTDRWEFTNDGTNYFVLPRPEEYDNVIYDVSIQSGTTPALSANLILNGRKSGNVISTDRIEIVGSGLVKVTRTNDDKLNIAAGVGTITVTNIDNAGNYVLDQFPLGTYRSAKYVYSALTTSYISGGPHHATGEILVLHDGANAYITQYAMLTSTDDDVINLDADINSGNLRLLATATSGGHLVTLKLTGITYTEI
jgi:hypothetical protein